MPVLLRCEGSDTMAPGKSLRSLLLVLLQPASILRLELLRVVPTKRRDFLILGGLCVSLLLLILLILIVASCTTFLV